MQIQRYNLSFLKHLKVCETGEPCLYYTWQKSYVDTSRKICETEEACLYYFWQKSDSNRIFNKKVLKQQKLKEHMKISAHLFRG
jgi:hypothetical protein